MKTIRLKFKGSDGKNFTLSMGHPKTALTEEGGKQIVKDAVDKLIEKQPLNRTITECLGVEVINKTVEKIL